MYKHGIQYVWNILYMELYFMPLKPLQYHHQDFFENFCAGIFGMHYFKGCNSLPTGV